jgi:SET domain-containing protein
MRLFPPFKQTPLEKNVESNIIEIRKSSIPNSGNGVFAKQDIPAATELGYYRGEGLDLDEFNKRHGAKGIGNYVLTLTDSSYPNNTVYVDGEHKGNWTSRMNSPRGTDKRPNVAFYDDGRVVAKRNIKAGEELFVGYGSRYWNSRVWKNEKNQRSKTRKQRGGKN